MDSEELCTRYVGLGVEFDISTGTPESPTPIPERLDLTEFIIKFAGKTGRVELDVWWGDAGIEIRQALSPGLFIRDEAEDDLEELRRCATGRCDKEGVSPGFEATCCPVDEVKKAYHLQQWIEEGVHTITAETYARVDEESRLVCRGEATIDIVREREDPRIQPFNIIAARDETLFDAHSRWHATRDGLAFFPGNDWLFFHYGLVRTYDEWREFYEYPPVRAWDGSTAVPATEDGYTQRSLTRPDSPPLNCEYGGSDGIPGCTPPPWFTRSGNGTPRPDSNAPGNMPCNNPDGSVVGGGQTKLIDFANSVALGCVVNRTHHAAMHATIPGAMRWVDESPFDPMFWRYHKWASGLRFDPFAEPALPPDDGEGLTAQTTVPLEPGIWGLWEQEQALGPPGVTGIWPPEGRVLASLPGIQLVFWEPVVGLEAGDLTVNGSPATNLEGGGISYFFSGYASPGEGSSTSSEIDVVVELAADSFVDLEGNAYPGETWGYTIGPDGDEDGIPDAFDNCPDVANRDQANTDADLVHGYHAHPGMVPTFGYAGDALGDACDDDNDDDGLSDALEEQIGTDPKDTYDPDGCPFDPKKTAPGECGCGVDDRDRDGDGEPECVPPLTAPTTTTTLPLLDCSLPISDGPNPTATDCLYILRTAVGLAECIPACACAPSGQLPTTATDALLCLNIAVGAAGDPVCPCPDLL